MNIYVICNPSCQIREQNMRRRLNNIGLLERSYFVPGGLYNDALAQHYALPSTERTVLCVIGHLKALRVFVDSGKERGCILEDDVLFRDDFKEQLDKLPDHTLVQLYTMSCPNDSNTNFGVYGTQGYVIRKDYAIKCLELYDKPLRYWKEGTFYTSEAITMYSNGIVLNSNPLIVEDSLSYSLSGNKLPNRDQIYHQLIPAFRYGIHRYIKCDPEYKIAPFIIKYIFDMLADPNLSTESLGNILNRVTEPETFDEEILIASLHMLSDYYLDKSKAQMWADRYFIALKNPDSKFIIEAHPVINKIAVWYSPSSQ